MEITVEQILALAKTSTACQTALKGMFPKAFTPQPVKVAGKDIGFFVCSRNYGNYKEHGFYLDSDYNWEIKTDSENELVLIPTTKGE